jgi:hypothetical protein
LKGGFVATILTLAASAIFLIAFVLYNRDLFAGRSSPSMASWILFCIITTTNSASYFAMTGDWVKTVVTFTDCFICYVTLAFLVTRRASLKRFAASDWVVIGICAIALGTWWFYRSATAGNLIMQTAAVLSTVPTYRGVISDSRAEPAAPWLLWTFAFMLQLTVVILRWEGHWADLANPIQAGIVHLGIGLLALRKPQ